MQQYQDPIKYDKRHLLNETEKYLHDRWHPFLISKIKEMCANKLVVDLGCGTCEFTQHIENAKLIVGLDFSIYMLEHGSQKFGHQKFDLINGDACCIPIKSEISDLIISIGLLPYVDINSSFNECRRILKNKGEIMIVFPNKWNPLNLTGRILVRFLMKLGKNVSSRDEYSYYEVKKNLEDIGFAIKEMRCFGMMTYSPLFLQRYVKYMWLFMEEVYAPFQSLFPLGSSIMVVAQKE